ncbi:MAG TPA: hypothetical protein VGP76_13085 [Planctomycetaceae bacterium]|jgi:hypothetical protein|nr:hypothetical protein [Planctomycetaceae bacterium]
MSKDSANRIKQYFSEQESRKRRRQEYAVSGHIGEWVQERECEQLSTWERGLSAEDQTPYVMLPQTISHEAAFSRLIELRQLFSETNIRDLMVSYDRLAESVRPNERTVLNIAHLIGVDDALGNILYMTGKLFDAPASVSVGEADPLSLVISVKVGADASVDASRLRERAWYENLADMAPQADGHVFLFVSYE